MTTIEAVLTEFIDAWNAGRRPDVADYAARVPASCRDEFVADLRMWLVIAPEPAYDERARAEIAADPILAQALADGARCVPPWPARLRFARARAGVAIDAVAAHVATAARLPGERARAIEYLTRAESGDLEENGLSRRLIEMLANALKTPVDELLPEWSASAQAEAVHHFRREDGTLDEDAARHIFDALSRAAIAPPPPRTRDELDRLFLGGERA